ncbi:interleukin-17 receptor C isoform X1 [Zootoca vivipara]|uniref:interleukin-17 receptor C isoform X1 n=1 Tax=Zootoca vivipara TaxID=8524 RepID=UPI00293BF91B|nr:interleukin-17 receptor C isoform X1 [Zootoca vivipara]
MTCGVEPMPGSRRMAEMWLWVPPLILVCLPSACLQPANILESVHCSQGLGCQLLEENWLWPPGDALPAPGQDPVLVLTQMETRNGLRCRQQRDCTPCVQVTLRLGLLEPPALSSKQDEGADRTSPEPRRHHGNTEGFLQAHVLLLAETYAFSHNAVMKVLVPRGGDWHNRSDLGSLQFDCFPVALSGELNITAFTRPHYQFAQPLRKTHCGPDCTWHRAKDAIRLCQVPRLEVSRKLDKAVLHVLDIPEGQHFSMWLYLNQTNAFKELGEDALKLLTGNENVSLPIDQVLPCLCLEVWPNVRSQEDSPRTHLCPFASDAEALSRAWEQSRLKLKVFEGMLSCSLSAPCDLPGELVPCWRGAPRASCHPLHPQLHLPLAPQVPQEFPGLTPHPNLCVQVRSNGNTYLQSCLQKDTEQHLLLRKTKHSQGSSSTHVLEGGTWVPIAQAASTGNGIPEDALQRDLQSGECTKVWSSEDGENHELWACSLQKYSRRRWALAWMMALLGTCSILLVLLLKKEELKRWYRILKDDYSSGGALRGRHILVLYSPDHTGFERLVGTLAGALARLQLTVSLELWSRGELRSLGPMQWLHAQRHRVLQEGGAVVLLFSRGARAACSEWLGWEQKDRLPAAKPDSTFLASLNCILPDFLAGKSRDRYMVACFEELFPADEIPALFRSGPVYSLPSQLFNFLLALAGPGVGQQKRNSLRRHAVLISKSLEDAVRDCRGKEPSWRYPPLLPPQSDNTQLTGTSIRPSVES